ncbi:MAG: hypothetical protein NT069_33600 [Planctomycetota bacterium]|nr:hypothetical protein [Planctomycetota bacterium]
MLDLETRVVCHARIPRTARAAVGGRFYPDLNRGNRRETVFHKPADFDALVAAMNDAQRRVSRALEMVEAARLVVC